MTKEEMLYDQYDNALFELLMHSVSQHQGQKYAIENEALKEQSDVGPSDSLIRHCLRIISHRLKQKSAHTAAQTISRVAGRVAIFILLIISCLTVALAVSPALRSNALHWAVKTFGDHAEFRLESQHGEGDYYQDITVGWLPDGYELDQEISSNPGINSPNIWKRFSIPKSMNAHILEVHMRTFSEQGAISADMDNGHVFQTTIHGCPAVVIEWEGSISVTWIYPDSNCIIDIYSEGESAATVLRVAESIEPIQ